MSAVPKAWISFRSAPPAKWGPLPQTTMRTHGVVLVQLLEAAGQGLAQRHVQGMANPWPIELQPSDTGARTIDHQELWIVGLRIFRAMHAIYSRDAA